MFTSLAKSLSRLFGTKSDRDLKEIQPIVDQILEAHKSIAILSNDELRAKTLELKERIKAYVAGEQSEIDKLKASSAQTSAQEIEQIEINFQ